MIALEQSAAGAVLPVRAKAGSRRNGIAGIHDGALIVSVTQVPQKGKANAAIAEVLAGALGLAKTRVELISGATSARKRFLIQGISIEHVLEQLEPLFDAGDQ